MGGDGVCFETWICGWDRVHMGPLSRSDTILKMCIVNEDVASQARENRIGA